MTFEEVLKKALEATGASAKIYAEVDEAVATIVEHATLLARSQNVDVTDLLNGDPEHDQAILDAAQIQGALNSSIDWQTIPLAVFESAWTILKVAVKIAAILYGDSDDSRNCRIDTRYRLYSRGSCRRYLGQGHSC